MSTLYGREGGGRRGRPTGWLPPVHAALSVSITLAEKIRLAVVWRLSMNVHFSLLAIKCSVVSRKAALCFSDRLPKMFAAHALHEQLTTPGQTSKKALSEPLLFAAPHDASTGVCENINARCVFTRTKAFDIKQIFCCTGREFGRFF